MLLLTYPNAYISVYQKHVSTSKLLKNFENLVLVKCFTICKHKFPKNPTVFLHISFYMGFAGAGLGAG